MIKKFNKFKKLFENDNIDTNLPIDVDYTYIKDKTTIDEIKKVCEEAENNNYYSVVVSPDNISTTKAFLEDTDIKVCAVIDFPKGISKSNIKIKEALAAITDDVDEIDFTFNFTKLKELSLAKEDKYQDIYDELLDEIKSVSRICHKNGIILKVIIETEEITFDQINTVCQICVNGGTDYIQTSTGFSKKNKPFSEKVEKIEYIRKILPNYIKIKATGGIRSYEQIEELKNLVDRIGTSIIIQKTK